MENPKFIIDVHNMFQMEEVAQRHRIVFTLYMRSRTVCKHKIPNISKVVIRWISEMMVPRN